MPLIRPSRRALVAIAIGAVVLVGAVVALRDVNVRTIEHLDGFQRTGDIRKIVVTATIGLADDIIAADARDDPTSVTVTVRVRSKPGTYPAIGIFVPVVVTLRDPLGDRSVRDPSGTGLRDLGVYRPEFRGPPDATTGIFFPVLQPASEIPLALVQGRLVLRGQCLWLQPAEGRELSLVLWPPGSRLEAAGNAVAVVDASGTRIALGDRLRGGGGETKDVAHVISLTGQKPPLACQTGEAYVRLYVITPLP